jgi:hypothetical protein
MNAAFGDWVHIARVTTVLRDRSTVRTMKSIAGLLLLMFVIGSGIALWWHLNDTGAHPKMSTHELAGGIARGALGAVMFWVAIVWGTVFIPGSVLLNSAANARLLPRQRRRLMQMAAAGWLSITLAFPIVIDSWATLPLCGLYLIALPMLLTGRKEAAPLVFLACGWPMLSRTVISPSVVAALARPSSVAVLSLLLVPLGVFALRVLYPAGGDAHIAQRAAMVKRLERQSTRGLSDPDGTGGRGLIGIMRLYGWALRRDCRRASPAAMLMHALGPAGYWSTWVPTAFWLTALAGALRLVVELRDGAVMREIMSGIGIGLVSMSWLAAFTTAQFSQQIRRTHAEQALLRLTPLAGDAALLNRRLARQLLKGALCNWMLVTATILLATLLVGGDAQALLRQFALCCLGGQVALMGLLGDYAREAGWNLMLALRAALTAAIEGAVAFGLGWWAGPSVWAWLLVIASVAAVFQVQLGRRSMLDAPVAFPAGRLA